MASEQNVQFATGAGTASGYLTHPSAADAAALAPRRGLIVLQEWWGLVPHIKDVAQRFAAQGFVALAPDLYHGKSTVQAEEASHLMGALDWSVAAQEIAGAMRYLRDVQGCTSVGVVGFCMGGALTVIAATLGADAYAAFYGFPPKGGAQLDRISAPGLLFFGEHETYFSVPDAQAFAASQVARGIATEVITYAGAGHAFFNDTRPEAYVAGPAADAWQRTLALFQSALK